MNDLLSDIGENPPKLEEEAARGLLSSGELALIRFALSAWNARKEWSCGRFDLKDADDLDEAGRQLVARWVESPIWP